MENVSRRMLLTGAAASLGTVALTTAGAAPAAAAPTPQEESLGITNVASFGAAGDGTLVRTELVAAIAAAGQGGVVYFPPGVYLVDQPLAPLDRQTWIGIPGVSVIKSVSGVVGFTLIDARDIPNSFRLEGLVIDGNRSQTTNPGFVYPTTSSEIPGVGLLVLAQPHAREVQVRDSVFLNLWNYGIVAQRFADNGSLSLTVKASRVSDAGGGLAAFKTTSLTVVESTFEDTTEQGIWGQHCQNVLVQGNDSYRHDFHGIVFTYSAHVQILSNHCVGNGKGPGKFGWGICMGGTSLLDQPNHTISVVGNVCHLNGSGGITHDPRWPSSTATHSQKVAISGNVCTSDGVIGINGISSNFGRDMAVTGNFVSGFPFHGLNLSNSTYTTVTGNVSTGNGKGIAIESLPAGPEGPYGHVVVSSNMIYENTVDYHIPEYPDGRQIDIVVMEPRNQLRVSAQTVGFFGVEPAAQPTGWAASMYDEKRELEKKAPKVVKDTNQVLATLISDLKRLGVLGG